MPQVEQPRWRDRHKAAFIALAALVVIGMVAGSLNFVVKPKTALAAGSSLPTAAGAAGNSDQESLAITQSTNNKTLIWTPVSWVKLYFSAADINTANIQIYNMAHDCSASYTGDINTTPSCTPGLPDTQDDQVLYDFYNTDSNEQISATSPLIYTIDSQTGKDVNSGAQIVQSPGSRVDAMSGNIPVPLGNTAISTHSGYYVVLMRIRWGNCPSAINDDCMGVLPPGGSGTRLHAVIINTTGPQDQLGYWAQEGVVGTGTLPTLGSFTTHYIGNSINFDIKNIEVDFATPCTVASPQTATLRWKNGDTTWVRTNPGRDGNQAGINPDIANSFQLIGISPTGVQSVVENMPGGNSFTLDAPGTPNAAIPANNIGGLQDYREVNFTAQPGWKYKWIWHNVDSPFNATPADGKPPGNGHNIQMWIPYDSINYDLNCGYNYSSTVAVADGKTPGTPAAPAPLDVTVPANQHTEIYVNGTNSGTQDGPTATTVPVCTENGAACLPSDVTPDGPTQAGGGNLNRIIPAGTTLLGSNTGVEFGYNISPTIPSGTILCFSDTISPVSPTNAGPAPSNQICFKVVSSKRFPSLIGERGDVQAGGGLCTASVLSNGSITGNGSAASASQYVLAASGSIGNFASNSGGANNLQIGAGGAYTQVCRPDLLKAALDGQGGSNQGTIGGVGTVNVDLGCLTTPAAACGSTTGGKDVYYFAGSLLQLSGQVNQRVTIVATNGSVEVVGPVTLNGASAAASATPSVGVIASNNIAIDSNVNQVSAYLFADGILNTCATPGGPVANLTVPCNVPTPVLKVNGFLMASNILFARLGPTGTTGIQTAEDVSLNPQLYINPPTFFDNSVNSVLQGQGERPPLF